MKHLIILFFFTTSALFGASSSFLPFSDDSCDLNKIIEQAKGCCPEQEECKDPVCPEPKCPEPKCPEISPFPDLPECPKPKDEGKCEEAATKCEQIAEKCEEKAEKCEETGKKCDKSEKICQEAQKQIDEIAKKLEEAQEEIKKGEEAKKKLAETEKKLQEAEKKLEEAENKECPAQKECPKCDGDGGDSGGGSDGDGGNNDNGGGADNGGGNPDGGIPDGQVTPDIILKDLLAEINKEREAAKVGKLYQSSRLMCAAKKHSEDMGTKKFCSHTGSDKSTPWSRAEKCGTKASGEIVACDQRTARATVEAWLRSPGHKKIMLGKDYKSVGIAMKNNYWTAIFSY